MDGLGERLQGTIEVAAFRALAGDPGSFIDRLRARIGEADRYLIERGLIRDSRWSVTVCEDCGQPVVRWKAVAVDDGVSGEAKTHVRPVSPGIFPPLFGSPILPALFVNLDRLSQSAPVKVDDKWGGYMEKAGEN